MDWMDEVYGGPNELYDGDRPYSHLSTMKLGVGIAERFELYSLLIQRASAKLNRSLPAQMATY